MKEDKATFFGTAICPIISLIATGFSFSIKSVKQFFGLSIDSCISWLYFLQAIFRSSIIRVYLATQRFYLAKIETEGRVAKKLPAKGMSSAE